MVGFGIKRRSVKFVAAFLAACLPAACGLDPVAQPSAGDDPATLVADCCTSVQRYPRAIIDLVEAKADRKSALEVSERSRPPFLQDKPRALAFILDRLEPLDIVTTSDKGVLRGQLMPGYFSHSMVYIGSEAQLRAAGLWDHPALRPHRAAIRAGQVFYEASPPDVHFSTPVEVLKVDAVGLYRVALSDSERQAVITELIQRHGAAFDWHFDSETADCFYCVELIDRSYPALGLRRVTAYDRQVIPPDSLARSAITGEGRVAFRGFVYGTETRAESAGRDVLAATLARHW